MFQVSFQNSVIICIRKAPLLRHHPCQILNLPIIVSADDGKSTLIGHILYDAKLLYTDQEKALELDSKVGSRGGAIDYSLLLDGLMAEREQGITIDVAYRYFTTDNRSFIVADTPDFIRLAESYRAKGIRVTKK